MEGKELIDFVNQNHEKAMNLCETAFFTRRSGQLDEAKKLFHHAFDCEYTAAIHTPKDQEPTRSVLYSSAMFCANDAGLKDEAIKLAEKIISFTTFTQIKEEAQALLNELKN